MPLENIAALFFLIVFATSSGHDVGTKGRCDKRRGAARNEPNTEFERQGLEAYIYIFYI